MDLIRKQLSELMGSVTEGSEDRSKYHFSDPKVCRYFVTGLCPHELFENTKFYMGPCEKVHSEYLKTQYEKARETARYYFEDECIRLFEQLVDECDKKIARGQQRCEEDAKAAMIEAAVQAENNKREGIDEEAILKDCEARIKHMDDLFEEKLKLVETLGESGDVDGSMNAMNDVELLKAEKEKLTKQLTTLQEKLSAQPQQKLKPCEVCGALLSMSDSDRRLSEHYTGKIHVGFDLIRKAVVHLKSMMKKNAKSETSQRKRDESKEPRDTRLGGRREIERRDRRREEERRNTNREEEHRDSRRDDERRDSRRDDERRDSRRDDERRDPLRDDDRREPRPDDDRRESRRNDERRESRRNDERRESRRDDERRESRRDDERRDSRRIDERRDFRRDDEHKDSRRGEERKDSRREVREEERKDSRHETRDEKRNRERRVEVREDERRDRNRENERRREERQHSGFEEDRNGSLNESSRDDKNQEPQSKHIDEGDQLLEGKECNKRNEGTPDRFSKLKEALDNGNSVRHGRGSLSPRQERIQYDRYDRPDQTESLNEHRRNDERDYRKDGRIEKNAEEKKKCEKRDDFRSKRRRGRSSPGVSPVGGSNSYNRKETDIRRSTIQGSVDHESESEEGACHSSSSVERIEKQVTREPYGKKSTRDQQSITENPSNGTQGNHENVEIKKMPVDEGRSPDQHSKRKKQRQTQGGS